MDSLTKKELAFIEKGRLAGFRIINHEGLEKIEINLQSPIKLLEDFEFLECFNHLVYITVEPYFSMKETQEEMKNYQDTQQYDIFKTEQIVDGESHKMMKKRLRAKVIKRMKTVVLQNKINKSM